MTAKLLALFTFLFLVLIIPLSTISGEKELGSTNPGSLIQDAINAAPDGGTVYIKSGIYEACYPIFINKSITLVGENNENTIVSGFGTQSVIFQVTASGAKIMNLTISDTSQAGGVGINLVNASHVEISRCKIANAFIGLELMRSYNVSISKNWILGSYWCGVYLLNGSSNNFIFENEIVNNSIGIVFEQGSWGNKVYHNDFLNNKNDVNGFGLSASSLDNGYPSGGNYWDTAVGVDYKSGSYQNETGSDGILDAAYGNDRYPLAGPIKVFWVGEWGGADYYVLIVSNFAPWNLSFVQNESKPFIEFSISGLNGSSGFLRVLIPKRLLWVENVQQWSVIVEGNSVSTNICDDREYTYLFWSMVLYNDFEDVRIIGYYAVPEYNIVTIFFFLALLSILFWLRKFSAKSKRC